MNRDTARVIKGDICYSKDKNNLAIVPDGYLVCEDGRSAGVFDRLPQNYQEIPLEDYSGKLVVPGLTDLHIHAPQYAFRGFKAGFTTEWIEKVLELYGDTIVRSLGIAVAALILCVVIGVPAAWILVRALRAEARRREERRAKPSPEEKR